MNNLLAELTTGDGGGAAPQNPVENVIGVITPPPSIQDLVSKGGEGGISTVLASAIKLIYEVAIILFVFMILFSALQWIISGGDKEKVANARNRLTYAIIGVVILGLAWVITSVLGQITGIDLPFK